MPAGVWGPPDNPPPHKKMVPWRRPRNPIHASPRPLTRDDKYQQNDETPSPHISLSLTRARAVPQGARQGVSLSFQGQEKVLVTGPWYSQTEPYQILFGGTPVATTLVQSGVLRCFAPGKSFPKSHHGFCFCCLINHSFKSLASFCESPNH